MSDARRVLVAGATAASGGGVLSALLEAGWRVAGTTRREPPGEPAGVTWVRADLARPDEVRAAMEEAVGSLGGLDSLVCLAGGGYAETPLEELSWGEFERQAEANLRTVVEVVVAALPALAEWDGGAIVTIGSRGAQAPRARSGPYAAAKAGVIALSAALAAELRPRGIRVNCLVPTALDTEQNRASMPRARRESWVSPRQLGEVIRFLASPESAPLTGAAIPI